MRRRAVEVVWRDACTGGGWADAEVAVQYSGLVECRSVGYLLARDAEKVVLVQSYNAHGRVADTIAIPRACVTQARRVR